MVTSGHEAGQEVYPPVWPECRHGTHGEEVAWHCSCHNVSPAAGCCFNSNKLFCAAAAPQAWLASQEPDLAGVVLHSPLLSGVRVLSPGLKWWPSFADVYPNHLMVPKIKAPTLIMHGTDDEVIHISCGKRLHELCKNAVEPLWAEGFNHQVRRLALEPVLHPRPESGRLMMFFSLLTAACVCPRTEPGDVTTVPAQTAALGGSCNGRIGRCNCFV